MSKRKKYEAGEVIFTIFALLMVIVPIIILIYLCCDYISGYCQNMLNGEFVKVKCSEIHSFAEAFKKYKGALIISAFGTYFLFPPILLFGKNRIKCDIVWIIIATLSIALSFAVTPDIAIAIILTVFHAFLLVGVAGELISELIKKHKK